MAAVLLPYFLMRKKEMQNVWLVLASWFFYGWVDLKMVPLLVVVTLVFYGLGAAIGKSNHTNPRRAS